MNYYTYIIRRCLACLVLLCTAQLVTGCSGVRIYNAEDDTMASHAVTQYASADMLQAIETESENLDKMLESEYAVVDRLVDLSLQREWLRLIRDPAPIADSLLTKVIGKRKQTLGIDDFTSEQITGVIRLEDELNLIDQQILDGSQIAESLFRVSFPPCSSAPFADQVPPGLLNQARRNRPGMNPAIVLQAPYDNHLAKCAERSKLITDTLKPFTAQSPDSGGQDGASPGNGLIAQSLGEWHQALEDLNKEKAQLGQLREQYNQLSAQLKSAYDARASLDTDSTEEKLESLSDDLGAALERISSQAGAVGMADASLERIEHIDILLSAIVDSEFDQSTFDSADTYESASVASGLLSIKAELKRLRAKKSLDPITGLIIEKQRQIALRTLANDRITRQQKRIDLLRDQYLTIVDELEILRSIEISANQENIDSLLRKPAKEVLTMRCTTVPCGEVQRILLKYIASVDYSQRRLQHLNYQLIDLEHRAALEESATAVRLWHTLIETPLNELAAYHASGMKSENLADLFLRFTTFSAITIGVTD